MIPLYRTVLTCYEI